MYTLNVSLTSQQLSKQNKDGMKVCVGKAKDGKFNVIWLAFHALENNFITWEEKYGIFASDVMPQSGAVINQNTTIDVGAVAGKLYTLDGNGVIEGPGAPVPKYSTSYVLRNSYKVQPEMVVGLFQDATLNGAVKPANAIGAETVSVNDTITMDPRTTIGVWLERDSESSSIIETVSNDQANFVFGNGISTINVALDDATGAFYQTSSN